MDTLEAVKQILRDALQLGRRADQFRNETPLLGSVPEFDSMAVVTVVTMLEEQFGLELSDDEISADIFETVGSLVRFVEAKTGS